MENTVREAPRTAPAKRALLCFAAFISLGAGPQLPPVPAPATAYQQLVADYRHRSVASLQRAAALTEGEIRPFVDEALTAGGDSSSWARDDLHAAAMMHTDTGLWLLKSGSADAAFAHLGAAIRLVEAAIRRDGSSKAFANGWYRNVSALIKSAAPASGPDLIKRAEPLLSHSEGDAAFARGLGLEIVACEVDPGTPKSGFGMRLSSPLRAAAGFYEEALRRDASLHEAALHLGRSRLLLGELAEARRWLEAATQSQRASHRYLALLYLGSMDEQDGRLEQAEARYRAAVAAFPWGQSGPLALARLLTRTNRENESRTVLGRMLELGAFKADPLWTYLASPGSEPGAVLHVMRAEIWQ
jgi:tetratricopeptide (TPR) repeat protein